MKEVSISLMYLCQHKNSGYIIGTGPRLNVGCYFLTLICNHLFITMSMVTPNKLYDILEDNGDINKILDESAFWSALTAYYRNSYQLVSGKFPIEL